MPAGLKTKIQARDIAIRCERMSLPGVWFSTMDGHRRYGYGPTDQNPETPTFDPVTLQFIVDKRGEVYAFFNSWMNLITNFNSAKGMKTADPTGVLPYESSYPSEFVVDMNVMAYDVDDQKVLKYHLIRAWPMRMEENEVAWAGQDQYVKLTAVVTYRDWNLTVADNSFVTDYLNFGVNKLERVSDKLMTNLVDSFF